LFYCCKENIWLARSFEIDITCIIMLKNKMSIKDLGIEDPVIKDPYIGNLRIENLDSENHRIENLDSGNLGLEDRNNIWSGSLVTTSSDDNWLPRNFKYEYRYSPTYISVKYNEIVLQELEIFPHTKLLLSILDQRTIPSNEISSLLVELINQFSFIEIGSQIVAVCRSFATWQQAKRIADIERFLLKDMFSKYISETNLVSILLGYVEK